MQVPKTCAPCPPGRPLKFEAASNPQRRTAKHLGQRPRFAATGQDLGQGLRGLFIAIHTSYDPPSFLDRSLGVNRSGSHQTRIAVTHLCSDGQTFLTGVSTCFFLHRQSSQDDPGSTIPRRLCRKARSVWGAGGCEQRTLAHSELAGLVLSAIDSSSALFPFLTADRIPVRAPARTFVSLLPRQTREASGRALPSMGEDLLAVMPLRVQEKFSVLPGAFRPSPAVGHGGL